MARTLREFMAKDPYNPNFVEGLLSYERSKSYGALTIRKVNSRKVDYPPIMGTPKLGYPFTRGGNFQFPSAEKILCFKKYDGSNILMFRYWDADGRPFISYKVRLWPFLRGKLIPMWNRMLAQHPTIKRIFVDNPDLAACSFEMYGGDHPHLIRYENKLDIALLFGLKRDGALVINTDINTDAIPKAELIKEVHGDYVWEYNQMRDEFGNRLELLDAENQLYAGEEGAVWYVKEKRTQQWRMMKCKPHQIELTHWQYQPLTREMLKATGLNILDEHPKITMELFKEYLSEEYPPHQIAESVPRIEKVIRQLNVKEVYTDKIHELMHEHGFTADTDPKVIMRKFADYFPRNKMGAVYRELQYVLQMENDHE